MASEWREFTFSELIDAKLLEIGDGYRAKISELGGQGPIFLRAGHVTETHIDFTEVDRFHVDSESAVTSKMSRVGDVIVTTKGNSTGRVAFVDPSMPSFVYSPHLSYWRSLDRAKITPGFLRYWSRSSQFRSQLTGLAGSTDMAPYLSLIDQRRLRITLPPPPDQKAIAHILGSLDNKIDLNRQTNDTLETMAQTVFKSWFVDFDPVRAKAEGCQPYGMNAETGALFADSFQDSTLGRIPRDWQIRPIGDMVNAVGGSTPSTEQASFWGGEINFCTPKDMASLRFPVLTTTERRITERGSQQISSGVLPKGTVLLSSRAPIGYLAVSEIAVAVNQGIIAMICDKGLPNLYVLQWIKKNMDAIVANANGTTFLEISKANFRPIPALVPPPAILSKFTELAEPLYRRIVANVMESETLSLIRDTLLPQLISGEIRVRDTAQLEGRAV
jgi:type I restriction enzyme S subunit